VRGMWLRVSGDGTSLVGRFEVVRARSLAPLEKARGFGMTALK
jgi:hypothetical protein